MVKKTGSYSWELESNEEEIIKEILRYSQKLDPFISFDISQLIRNPDENGIDKRAEAIIYGKRGLENSICCLKPATESKIIDESVIYTGAFTYRQLFEIISEEGVFFVKKSHKLKLV